MDTVIGQQLKASPPRLIAALLVGSVAVAADLLLHWRSPAVYESYETARVAYVAALKNYKAGLLKDYRGWEKDYVKLLKDYEKLQKDNEAALKAYAVASDTSVGLTLDSALLTHCAVVLFIESFALGKYFRQKQVTFLQAPGYVLGCANDEVEGKLRVNDPVDPYRLIDLIPRRHNDENVHVAVVVRRTISVRPEQDDLFRLETLGHLPRVAPDDPQRNVRPAVPARQWRSWPTTHFLRHTGIVHPRRAERFPFLR